MLAIRLQRIGKKNRPSYRVVVSEKSRDLYGKHLEILGSYNPVAQPKTVNLKEDRIKYWISVGAQPSKTMHNILVSNNIIEAKKVQSWKPKKKKEGPKQEEAQTEDKAPETKDEPKEKEKNDKSE